MRFLIKTGNEVKGNHLTQVETLALETDSYVARTNRRKLRVWLVRELKVRPDMVKWALKELGFWDAERIGVKDYGLRQAAIAADAAANAST